MIKNLMLGLTILVSLCSYSQDTTVTNSNKFLFSVHYVGNLRNENFFGDGYNGIVGIDTRYSFLTNESVSVEGGLGLDYFQGRTVYNQVDIKNRLMINPNIGITFTVSKLVKPFLNLGYSFFTAKYSIKTTTSVFDQMDPAFQSGTFTSTDSYNSLSINPGLRVFVNKELYFQADYKFLPIQSNINGHIVALGIGINL